MHNNFAFWMCEWVGGGHYVVPVVVNDWYLCTGTKSTLANIKLILQFYSIKLTAVGINKL